MNVGNVTTREQAQAAIAALLTEFAGEVATQRVEEEATFAKQTSDETVWRVAGNVLNSLVTRKPNGEVVFP